MKFIWLNTNDSLFSEILYFFVKLSLGEWAEESLILGVSDDGFWRFGPNPCTASFFQSSLPANQHFLVSHISQVRPWGLWPFHWKVILLAQRSLFCVLVYLFVYEPDFLILLLLQTVRSSDGAGWWDHRRATKHVTLETHVTRTQRQLAEREVVICASRAKLIWKQKLPFTSIFPDS